MCNYKTNIRAGMFKSYSSTCAGTGLIACKKCRGIFCVAHIYVTRTQPFGPGTCVTCKGRGANRRNDGEF